MHRASRRQWVPLYAATWLMLASCGWVAAADVEPSAEWRNTLKPAGQAALPLTLVADGAPRYAILLPARPTAPERKAAEDLQHWLKQITGGELAVVGEDQLSPGASRFISIGATDLLRRSGGGDGRDLADEGYEIAVRGEHLLLRGGRTRGIVNAVYAVLEEDLGCRWYTRTDHMLPRAPTLTLPVVPRSYVPRLKLRDPYYQVSFDPAWSLRNRTNAPDAAVPEEAGGHVDYGGHFVHTHAALLPPGQFFKDHPNYFAMNANKERYPAQVCPTEPAVVRIITENVLKTLRERPHTEIVSVSKNDNAGDQICHCERCVKLRADEGGTDMANQLFLVNRVAEAVEKEFPRVVIDTLAYLETIQVPKTIRPRRNVAIRLCNDAVGAWARPFTPAEQCDVAKLIGAWSAVHDRIYVWDYNVNFSHYLAPMPNLDVVASNIRFWVKNNAEGVMTQGGYQGAAERDELKSWVIAKLLWDPSRDEGELANDFILGHYGKAAPAVAEYDALLRQLRQTHPAETAAPPGGIRYLMDAPFFSKEFLDRAAALFVRAAELAGQDQTLLHRVERAELPVLYVKLSRGPRVVGDGYAALLDRFERIARRESATHLAEGPADLDAKLAAWRKQVQPSVPR